MLKKDIGYIPSYVKLFIRNENSFKNKATNLVKQLFFLPNLPGSMPKRSGTFPPNSDASCNYHYL